MKWLENKYIALVSYRLEKFKKKNASLYNFRCPFCGDSQTSKYKARGYLFEKKGGFWFHCHNCKVTRTFSNFLRTLDLTLYNEYRLEWMRENENPPPITPGDPFHDSKKYDDTVFKDLTRIVQLSPEHFARAFVAKRQIPAKFHSMLFFAPNYEEFVNSVIPEKLKGFKGPRLVIPFYSFKREVVGWQGRALDDHLVRYSYIVIDYVSPRAFGLNDVNFNKKYYVLEGPIDSMFLDNAIAIGGSDLVGGIRRLGCNRENAILVWDNEPRNSQIVERMKTAIANNYSVVIWPPELPLKDINDMILDGGTPAQVQHLIDRSARMGLTAELAFNAWKKI